MRLNDIITPEQLDKFMHPGHDITETEKREVQALITEVQPFVDVYRKCRAKHGSKFPPEIELTIISNVFTMLAGAIAQVHALPKN